MSPTDHHSEELAIWQQIKDGSESALVQLYDRYMEVLFNYGKRFTQKSEIIEDAVQDLLTELWLKREKLSVPHSVKAYLLKAFRQKLLRQLTNYRRLSFSPRTSYFLLTEDNNFLTGQISAELEATFHFKFKRALASLSPKQQEAIALRYTENLSHEEIARIMNIKKQTLYNLLHSAILRLSDELKDERKAYVYLFLVLALLYLTCVFSA